MQITTVAILMSTLNEAAFVDASLDALAAQTHAPGTIIVVDGGSQDGTVERLRRRAARDERIRVHADGVRRSLPEALNIGLEMVSEPFVAKIDARTFVAPEFLERALHVFTREGPDVACVGGRPEQYGDTDFGEGLARARMSPFGVGGSGYADARARSDADTVQCGVYRREALLRVGGFDPALQFGEDEELNWRLRQAGYRIVRDPDIRFRYLARPTWLAAFRQYRNYGRARARVLAKHPAFLRPRHLVPSSALLLAAGMLCAAPSSRRARRMACGAAAAYTVAAAAAALAACRDDLRHAPHTAAAFPALHAGYGIGFVEGWLLRAGFLRVAG
jgi:succinoglycan biosynthesis protein ExoA